MNKKKKSTKRTY